METAGIDLTATKAIGFRSTSGQDVNPGAG